MAEKEIIEIVNQILEEEFEIDPQKLQPDAAIFTDLGMDSLDIVDLIVALEKAFQIKSKNSKESWEKILTELIEIKRSQKKWWQLGKK